MIVRKLIAVALAGSFALPTITIASNEGQDASRFDAWQDRPDQASRRDLRREHLVRSLLRNVSERPESGRRAAHFTPLPDTPTVNGLKGALLTNNPNLNAANGAGATNPFRLSRSQAWTASQNHDYMPEQAAFDKGLMDLFPAEGRHARQARR